MATQSPPFRLLPSIDRLLRLQQGAPAPLAKEAARILVAELRDQMARSWPPAGGEAAALADDALAERLRGLREQLERPFHARVINATGILLHTGLGRAPLPDRAIAAMQAVARQGYVEIDPESGKRSRRELAVARHLCAVTGAEAAMVVNNNAAATLLALDAVARGGEVVLSRGELVEIGGGFRMPDVMKQAGCDLVEVGTTNRTRLRDYERAITAATRCLLKVHPSNYRIEGFTAEVALTELVELGARRGVPVVEDLGSGLLLDEPLPHDPREPSVQSSVRAGADLVCFSGDKLLGSCQAGVLVGRADWIAKVAGHPLYRALRLSKIALAGLEATLWIYRFGDPKQDIPVLRATWTDLDALTERGEQLLAALRATAESLGFAASLIPSQAYLGSGASPARALESRAVALAPRSPRLPVEDLARRLRTGRIAIFPRIEEDRLLFDLRSLAPDEWQEVASALQALAAP